MMDEETILADFLEHIVKNSEVILKYCNILRIVDVTDYNCGDEHLYYEQSNHIQEFKKLLSDIINIYNEFNGTGMLNVAKLNKLFNVDEIINTWLDIRNVIDIQYKEFMNKEFSSDSSDGFFD